jgi:ATP-dependent Clp protease ATP-binding subunit ClpA
MKWEDILKEDGVSDDYNEILASLRKARKLCARYSEQNNIFADVEKMAHNAIKELTRISEEEMNDLFNPDKAIRVADDAKEVPSGQYISSRGFEDRR